MPGIINSGHLNSYILFESRQKLHGFDGERALGEVRSWVIQQEVQVGWLIFRKELSPAVAMGGSCREETWGVKSPDQGYLRGQGPILTIFIIWISDPAYNAGGVSANRHNDLTCPFKCRLCAG